jgi:hypothetical protein
MRSLLNAEKEREVAEEKRRKEEGRLRAKEWLRKKRMVLSEATMRRKKRWAENKILLEQMRRSNQS